LPEDLRQKLRRALGDRRVRRAALWGVPLTASVALGLLLSPGLARIGHRETIAPRAAIPPSEGSGFEVRARERPPAPADTYAVLSPRAPDPLAVRPAAEPTTLPDPPAEPIDLSTRFDCIIEPSESVDLGSPVTGIIETIHVERSDFVETGQPIAALESGVEKAAVELARARASLQGTIKAREASVALGESRQERVNRLFEKNTLSLDLREQAQTEAEIARRELLEARESQRLASLELQQAFALLERRTIRSPISGVVVERFMAPGEVVVDEKTILTIAQIDPLRVEVILPSALFGSVRPGMRAAVEPEFGEQVHVASVRLVDRLIDAASGTFGVRLDLPNPDHSIPGGLHCQVHFLSE
jgi:RND family efflux transporter MFP subunit